MGVYGSGNQAKNGTPHPPSESTSAVEAGVGRRSPFSDVVNPTLTPPATPPLPPRTTPPAAVPPLLPDQALLRDL